MPRCMWSRSTTSASITLPDTRGAVMPRRRSRRRRRLPWCGCCSPALMRSSASTTAHGGAPSQVGVAPSGCTAQASTGSSRLVWVIERTRQPPVGLGDGPQRRLAVRSRGSLSRVDGVVSLSLPRSPHGRPRLHHPALVRAGWIEPVCLLSIEEHPFGDLDKLVSVHTSKRIGPPAALPRFDQGDTGTRPSVGDSTRAEACGLSGSLGGPRRGLRCRAGSARR